MNLNKWMESEDVQDAPLLNLVGMIYIQVNACKSHLFLYIFFFCDDNLDCYYIIHQLQYIHGIFFHRFIAAIFVTDFSLNLLKYLFNDTLSAIMNFNWYFLILVYYISKVCKMIVWVDEMKAEIKMKERLKILIALSITNLF